MAWRRWRYVPSTLPHVTQIKGSVTCEMDAELEAGEGESTFV